ncbi:TPA: exotoxin beta-grasp domain-containing protein [Streptococcus pyogenes]|nr:exotoxin beta-grasp domain-containing protein [Streptococcus pyogenes]WSE65725.1 exotoxin beta-grasp domain-containing protein [Streptococcus pyogenes]
MIFIIIENKKYPKGTVTLDLNSGKYIVFDLYYFCNGDFNSVLKIYSNNERVASTQFHVDNSIGYLNFLEVY